MPIDAVFLGHRFMGKAHANALARLPMFDPDAPEVNRHTLVGRDEDALREAADRLGFDRIETDWSAALDHADALWNLGPNALHPEPSIAALERDVAVLCEKPLAHTLDAAEEMADAAAASSAVAGTAFNYRFLPAVRYARDLVADGELGEIRQVRARYLQDWLADASAPWVWRCDEETAGSGALGDLGAHSFDLARFLVGDRVGEAERVSGHTRTFVTERPVDGKEDAENPETRPVTVDDAFSAQVAYDSGAMGTFEATRMAQGRKNDNAIAVHGSAGSLRFSLTDLNELEVSLADDRGFRTVSVTGEDAPYGDQWWPVGHDLGWEHSFVHENGAFLRAVAGAGDFDPSFQDGLEIQRLVAAVQESDERGEWVTV